MYQIVLTENRKKIKVLHTYSRESDVNYRFEKLKSQVIFFPKTKIYRDKKLVDVNYEILLLKKRTENDDNRIIKNELGKFVEEVVDDNEWVIVDTAPYLIEETFNISGANRKLTAKEIVDYVVLPNKQKKAPKQVLMLNNKIVDIIFFGSIPKENRKTWYKKIHERTGIGYNRLYRSNSR